MGARIRKFDVGDADNDGDTDGADFLTWQRQVFGGAAPLMSTHTSVPEPTTITLALLLLASVGFVGSGKCLLLSMLRLPAFSSVSKLSHVLQVTIRKSDAGGVSALNESSGYH